MISGDFFQFIPCLKVLNLSNSPCLEKLPLGISRLVSPKHLDLSSSCILELSKELGFLGNLACLNLEHTSSLHTIPRQRISNLSKLRVLRMFRCYCKAQDMKADSVLFGGREFLVEEMHCLKHLNMFSITLKCSDALQKFLSSSRLQNCMHGLELFGGASRPNSEDTRSLKVLPLAEMRHLEKLHIVFCTFLQEFEIESPGEVQEIREIHGFHSLQTVELNVCTRLRDLTWLIFAPNLRKIDINQSSRMEEIIRVDRLSRVSERTQNLNPFEKHELIKLSALGKLKSIYQDVLHLKHLKGITVSSCPNLKRLPLNSNSAWGDHHDHKLVIEVIKGGGASCNGRMKPLKRLFFPVLNLMDGDLSLLFLLNTEICFTKAGDSS